MLSHQYSIQVIMKTSISLLQINYSVDFDLNQCIAQSNKISYGSLLSIVNLQFLQTCLDLYRIKDALLAIYQAQRTIPNLSWRFQIIQQTCRAALAVVSKPILQVSLFLYSSLVSCFPHRSHLVFFASFHELRVFF